MFILSFIWSLQWWSYSTLHKTQSFDRFLAIIKTWLHICIWYSLSNLLVIKTVIVFMPQQSHPHCNFVFLWYLGTWVTFIGFWTNIKTLPSLHLYQYTYCTYLVQSHVRDRVRVWAGVGQWLNRWGWCTEMEHSSAPVVGTYQRSHRALFAATRRVLSPREVEGVSPSSSV